jgi:hypothetical protein
VSLICLLEGLERGRWVVQPHLDDRTRIERFEAIRDSPPKACSSAFPAFRPKRHFALLARLNSMAKGNLTWLGHTVVNGTLLEADWPAAGGTYSVNANCTGTAMVNTPNSPVPLKLAFVVVKEGKEVRTVLDTNAIQLSIHQSRLSAS